MLQSCRYCGQQLNGYGRVLDHEMRTHRKQYFTDVAARERTNAEKSLAQAAKYQSYADEIKES